MQIVAWVSAVGTKTAPQKLENLPISRQDVDAYLVRCPHKGNLRVEKMNVELLENRKKYLEKIQSATMDMIRVNCTLNQFQRKNMRTENSNMEDRK